MKRKELHGFERWVPVQAAILHTTLHSVYNIDDPRGLQ